MPSPCQQGSRGAERHCRAAARFSGPRDRVARDPRALFPPYVMVRIRAPMNPVATRVTSDEALRLLERPLLELVLEAALVHRRHHDPRAVQCSQLLSIKTGGCP